MDQEKGQTESRRARAAPTRFPSPTVRHQGRNGSNTLDRLQNEALRATGVLDLSKESSTSCILEHLSDTLASPSRALEVLSGPNLLSHCHTLRMSQSGLHSGSSAAITYLLRSHRPLVRLPQLLNHSGITSEILLAGNQNCRKTGAEMHHLRDPLHKDVSRGPSSRKVRCTHLLLNVVKRVRGVNGEADQDDMRVGVTERTETVIILLSGRIPQGKFNMLPVNFDIGNIVLEHGRDINLSGGTSY
jgi:hypothetical protein